MVAEIRLYSVQKTICGALLLTFLVSCSFPRSSVDGGCPMILPRVMATVGGHGLELEVASTQESRECGLSGHAYLAADHGMLFVLTLIGPFSLWMKDTELPLAAAFIDDEGRIIAIEQMEPMRSDLIYRSPEPVRYALEVNQGWFAEHHVTVGTTVHFSLPPGLKIK